MRIAVLSDIHGNPFACDAVLKSIKDEGIFDTIVAAGDLCYGGSNPSKCVDMLLDSNIQAVQGNTDTYIFNRKILQPKEENRQAWNKIMETATWAGSQIGKKREEWLRSLPFELRFSPTDNPEDSLLIVHANPKNNLDFIAPPQEDQIILFSEIKQPDNDKTLIGLLADETAKVIAFGHVHYSSVRYCQKKTLVNVAPSGGPSIDGDKRAHYTIFSWNRDKWDIEQRIVRYAHQKHSEALLASNIPYKEEKAINF